MKESKNWLPNHQKISGSLRRKFLMQLIAFIDSIFLNKEDINIILDIFTDVYSMPGLVQYVHNYCCFLPAGDLNEFSPTYSILNVYKSIFLKSCCWLKLFVDAQWVIAREDSPVCVLV